jgi:hypothetical protein
MIGLYIVDGILIAGIVYLCCSPFKTYSSIENEELIYKEYLKDNYLSFDDKKVINIV